MQNAAAETHSRTEAIARRLEEILGEPPAGELRRLSSGASRETFAFATPARGELVVQIARGGAGKIVTAPPEVPLLEAAAAAGVPVPAVIAHGGEDEILGASWTVLEALPGSADPKTILAADDDAAAQLIDDLAGALAAIHRIPPDGLVAAEVQDPLALLREWHDRLGEPHPTFELAFRSLESERPPASRHALVHGDFRMGNLMVDGGRLTGVLDWELAHAGDPVEDLGWLCVPAWRFARRERPAAGLGAREDLLRAYERHSGTAVVPAAQRWWELAATLRWGVICVMQAFTHLSGATRSVEHAVIGRRACEVEWDLLELLGASAPVTSTTPAAPANASAAGRPATPATPATPALHDRPTALELLEAARGALGDDVLPQLQGRAAFQLRVSLRALGMVRRELALGERHAAEHAAALASVGCADEAQLARAIREGALEDRDPAVLAAVRTGVRAKLEVANPGYLEQTEAEQAKQDAEQAKQAQQTRTAGREEER